MLSKVSNRLPKTSKLEAESHKTKRFLTLITSLSTVKAKIQIEIQAGGRQATATLLRKLTKSLHPVYFIRAPVVRKLPQLPPNLNGKVEKSNIRKSFSYSLCLQLLKSTRSPTLAIDLERRQVSGACQNMLGFRHPAPYNFYCREREQQLSSNYHYRDVGQKYNYTVISIIPKGNHNWNFITRIQRIGY